VQVAMVRFDHMIDVMVGAKFGPASCFDAQVRNCSPAFHLFDQCTHIYYSHSNYRSQRPRTSRCKDVPSFDHLRRVQKQLRTQCGTPSIPCKSPLGNVFFMNDPRAIVAKVFSRSSFQDFTELTILLQGLGKSDNPRTPSGVSRNSRGWHYS
jgi:hypothetical protein